MADAGKGTFQIVLDAFQGWDKEYRIVDEVTQATGRPATFTLASANEGPPRWRNVLDLMAHSRARGAQVTAQVMPRPIGLVGGLAGNRPGCVSVESARAGGRRSGRG